MQLGAAFAGRADQHHREARDRTPSSRAPPCRSATRLRCRPASRRRLCRSRDSRAPRAAPHAQARSEPQSSGLRGWPLLTRPMMPLVRPAPLSAWMLAGLSDGVAPAVGDELLGRGRIAAGGAGRRRTEPADAAAGGAGRRRPAAARRRRTSSSRGTGPFASAGVTSVIWMSTVIAGIRRVVDVADQLLGRRPARPPTVHVARCCVTVHVTFGTFFGTRPSTSRSKSSTISGRRCFHHTSALRDLACRSSSVSTSGRFGIRIGQRLVVVGVVGRRLVAARPGPQALDPELLHHLPMIFLGRLRGFSRGRGLWRRRGRCGAGGCAGGGPAAAKDSGRRAMRSRISS